jgi:hypothetical protein
VILFGVWDPVLELRRAVGAVEPVSCNRGNTWHRCVALIYFTLLYTEMQFTLICMLCMRAIIDCGEVEIKLSPKNVHFFTALLPSLLWWLS